MKRNFVAKMLMISLTASMLLGSTSAFAADLTTSEEPTTITQEVEMSDTSSDEVDEAEEADAQTTEDEAQAVAESAESSEDETLAKSSGGATVSYRTHVQTYGWQDYVSNGNMSGTEGQAKRLEGINIKLENQDYEGGITYRTHVQTYGWQDYVSDDAMSGTEGEAKRLEAIQIELTGEMAEHYDIYYRVHSQTYGWLGWAKNGEKAGTSNYAKRLEGIQIVLVEKGGEAPGSTDGAYKHPWIGYSTHVQTYGWQGFKFDGDTAGTSGQSKRLEGIQLKLVDQPYEGSIQYKTHVQTYGWQDWVSDGATSGTTGEAKRLEAIQIQLTGEMAEHFDIYYRVHSQTYGWLGWAKNGESAGTEGYAKRLEAIEVLLVEKGNETPSSDSIAFVNANESTSNDESYVEENTEESTGDESSSENTSDAKHEHNWVEQTKTIHHDAEYSYTENEKKASEAKTAKEKAQNEVDLAKVALASAKSAQASAETAVKTAQKAVDQAQTEYNSVKQTGEEAEAKISDGSYAFFEAMGATEALDVLNNSTYSQYNVKGDKKDATALENMKKSLDYIEEFLNIRKKDGLSTDVKVSDSMMAMAQADANASVPLGNVHPHVFPVGENLMFGSDTPFDYWYTFEKECYENPEKYPWGKTGHYLALTSDWKVTGFGVAYNTSSWNGDTATCAQVFSNPSEDTMYSFSEYKTRFMNYYNKLKSASDTATAKKNTLDSANTTLTNAEKTLTEKTNAVTAANNTLTVKNKALSQTTSAYQDAAKKANDPVLLKDAYDETVVMGYTCSDCGATK